MLPINRQSVRLKNLIGIVPKPTYDDLLYEIVNFLDNEMRFDGEFKLREVSLKTNIRITGDLTEDVMTLVDLGYLQKTKQSNYIVLKHLWEHTI